MRVKTIALAAALLTALAACGQAPVGSDRFATQVANEIRGTQTAVAGTALNAQNVSRIAELARYSADPVTHVGVSASGDVVCYATVSALHVVDAGAFEQVRSIALAGRLDTFAVSADGRYAAGGDWSDVILWSLDGSDEEPLDVQGVHALAFTPDGRSLIALTWDGLISLQVPSGQEQFRVSDLYGPSTFTFHPETGQIVVPQSPDSSSIEVTLFDPVSGAYAGAWQFDDPAGQGLETLAFSPDGSLLALGWSGAAAELWSMLGDTPARELVLPDESAGARQTAFLSGGRQLALARWGGTTQVWNLETGTLSDEWVGRSLAVAVAGDVAILASSGSVQRRQLPGGEVSHTLRERSIDAIALSPDGKLIFLGLGDGAVELWDLQAGVKERTLESDLAGVRALAFSPRGGYLQALSPDGLVRVWRTSGWEPVSLPAGAGLGGFTPDEALLVGRTSNPNELAIWDATTFAVRTVLPHAAPVESFIISPSGDLVAANLEDGSIWLWDVHQGEFIRSLDDYLNWDNLGRIFSQDESLLAAVDDSGMLRIWNVADASLAYSQQLSDFTVWIELAPDFSGVWTQTQEDYYDQLGFWRPAEGELVMQDGSLGPLSSDGKLLCHSTRQEVQTDEGVTHQNVDLIRNTATGDVVQSIVSDGWAMEFSLDGSLMLVGFSGCEAVGGCPGLRFLSVESGETLAEVANLDGFIGMTTQSSHGSTIAGISSSGTVYVWGLR